MDRISARAAIAPFYAMEIMREASARAAAGQDIVRFDVGQPHEGAPEAAIAAAEAALRTDKLGYTDALGAPALREAIAAHYQRSYGVTIDPARVVITTGASGAFVLAFLALFNTGDRVALAAPGYPPYRHILTALGMAPAVIEARIEDGLQLTGALLRAQAGNVRGALVASPANPTGAMLSRERLADLAAAARERGAALISDEIYHGLVYEGRAETALAVAPEAIVINSFSKYWAMTGWRVGWLIAPPDTIKPLERLAQNLFICPPAPAQAAALAALAATEACDARTALYAHNRTLLLEGLTKLGLPPVVRPDGAFYVLVDVSRFGDSGAFAHRALDAGVALTPGVDFDEARGAGWARLSYCVAAGEIERGLERLARLT